MMHGLIKKNMSESNKDTFVSLFEGNINRVFTFVSSKHEELGRRLEKISTKGEISKISAVKEEMQHLAEFVRINIAGFKKLLNRYDKKTGLSLVTIYKPLIKEKLKIVQQLDELIYSTSRVVLKNSRIKKSSESNSSFIRRTDKYLVHPDNIHALKFNILQHLPIFVFSNDNKGSPFSAWNHKTHDTRISSVYFDNTSFELYSARIKKLHLTEAIRMRWYGASVPDVVFVERKKHEDGWTGETSKKLRFKIHENKVVDFINGLDVWQDVESLNGKEVRELYEEIQNAIVNKRLRPIVRTYYKRQAFQLPNDSSVRLSLDTELCMIKECPEYEFDSPTYPLKSWRRGDVVCDYPFSNLSKSEIVRFPYAILEIKTQSFDEVKPVWVENLISSPLVEHVHKFSKYLYGCAVLYPFIEEIPYRLPQMSTSIRKDPFDSQKSLKMFDDKVVLIDVPAPEENIDSAHHSPIDTHDKKISIPVRVEPKVFFANERTFLSWVQFAIFWGGIGTAMLGLGESKSSFSGVVLIVVSIIFSFYSLYLYLWRAGMIRKRHPGPYDGIYGPPVLVCVFLLAMALSIIYKFPLKRVI
ncbi:Vacuolar transporter chaperone 4 [Araneus ventricosus]|uniref:Vacuolar transporter chaperone 4 n=1 Tax=Araneus ventricosus TaxID=182803 RepID=A0A4Y2QUV5_ARAVE|nr:Vacuolar transporter chaperone 4 [Araneus ventricosus]